MSSDNPVVIFHDCRSPCNNWDLVSFKLPAPEFSFPEKIKSTELLNIPNMPNVPVVYTSVEHRLMHYKTQLMGTEREKWEFANVKNYTDMQANNYADLRANRYADLQTLEYIERKRIARGLKNYDDKVWSELRYPVAFEAVRAKFLQNRQIQAEIKLYPANVQFAYANETDLIWGTGLAYGHKNGADPAFWPGQNMLGRIISEVRKELK